MAYSCRWPAIGWTGDAHSDVLSFLASAGPPSRRHGSSRPGRPRHPCPPADGPSGREVWYLSVTATDRHCLHATTSTAVVRGYPSPRPFVGSKTDTPAGRPGKKGIGPEGPPTVSSGQRVS